MEVHVRPELAKKLTDRAASTGRPADDLVHDAVAGYLEELASLRDTLDSCYDDLKKGRVTPIDGEEADQRVLASPTASARVVCWLRRAA